MLRWKTAPPILLTLVIGLAACGDGDPGDVPDTQAQERIAELEGELDQMRDRVAALEQENEALVDDLAAMREASPDAADDGTDDVNGETAGEPIEWPSDLAGQWTAEGLIDQPRLHLRDLEDVDMPEGWNPGMTAWVPFEVPDEVRGVYDRPGQVMAELAAVIDAPLLGYDQWETTIRVLLDEDDPALAYGALLGWGFLDDSVVGRDIRITLTRTDDERWEPGGAEQRQHCMRRVSGDQTACV